MSRLRFASAIIAYFVMTFLGVCFAVSLGYEIRSGVFWYGIGLIVSGVTLKILTRSL